MYIKNIKIQKKILFLLTICIISIVIFYYFFIHINKRDSLKRMLASYTVSSFETVSRSKKIIENSRKLHFVKDYKSANKILSQLLVQYPYTQYKEEASFLLAKGLFYASDFTASKAVIQDLQDLDLNSKWLGYSLIIKGRIYAQQGYTQDAIQIYRTVIAEYSDSDLIHKAESALLNIR